MRSARKFFELKFRAWQLKHVNTQSKLLESEILNFIFFTTSQPKLLLQLSIDYLKDVGIIKVDFSNDKPYREDFTSSPSSSGE